MECNHKEKRVREIGRKNYPFGKKSKPRYMGVKKVRTFCKSCKKLLSEKKVQL